MPHIEANGIRVRYEVQGPGNAPVLAFSNSLGTNFHMWDWQANTLADRFRILRYDTRGHGETSAPSGPYSIQQLAEDLIALLDALDITNCAFCGLSMGGMIGLWLGANKADRINKLVIANSAPKIGTADGWNQRIAKVKNDGMARIANDVVSRWFTPEFLKQQPDKVATLQQMLEETDPNGYSACCEAIRDMDQRETISSIILPTLIISGQADPVTPSTEGDQMANAIAGAKHVRLNAAHLSNVEREAEFTSALLSFLEDKHA